MIVTQGIAVYRYHNSLEMSIQKLEKTQKTLENLKYNF